MDTDTPAHPTTATSSARRPMVATLAATAAVLVALGVVALGTAIEQAAHPPTCYGIGFGCVPDPGTTALLVGMIVGAPTLAVATLLTWVAWATTRRHDDRINRTATWCPTVLLVVIDVGLLVAMVATAG